MTSPAAARAAPAAPAFAMGFAVRAPYSLNQSRVTS